MINIKKTHKISHLMEDWRLEIGDWSFDKDIIFCFILDQKSLPRGKITKNHVTKSNISLKYKGKEVKSE